MGHDNEYHDSMVAMLGLVWGEGFMSPGGEGHVARMVDGIALEGRRVLDIGCGVGGPACTLARDHGAFVVGSDLEPPLIERSRRRAEALGLGDRTDFRVVRAGPLTFEDESFDLVMSSGGVTQTADKLGIFRECLRVLKPAGHLSIYDWMRTEGEYSDDMRYWFETEGLTYAMETPERQESALREAGFEQIELIDASTGYRTRVGEEFERLSTVDKPRLVDLIGQHAADLAVENWRATMVVCEKGEMLQVYSRARKPNTEEH